MEDADAAVGRGANITGGYACVHQGGLSLFYNFAHPLIHLGLEEKNLSNSPGWLAVTIASYCLGRSAQLTKINITKYTEQLDGKRCTLNTVYKGHS